MNDKDVNSYEASLGYKPSADINKLCEKHDLSRHDLIVVATRVARVLQVTPNQALLKLENVENLSDYLVSLKFQEAEG